jgi:hypothetical protein
MGMLLLVGAAWMHEAGVHGTSTASRFFTSKARRATLALDTRDRAREDEDHV